jgi:hypothetical protein
MTKRGYSIDQASIDRLINEGRGQGRLADYTPWKIVQGTPSSRTVWRELGWKSGRQHHLFSTLEWNYFCEQQWSPIVVDSRENIPLLPIGDTLAIAEECGYTHPSQPSSIDPRRIWYYSVLTTSFLITISDGASQKDLARTVIYSNDLEKPSFPIAQLEIQRRYWESRNIEWSIVTEREVNAILAKNVDTVYKRRWINEYVRLPLSEIGEIASHLTSNVKERTGETLRRVAVQCDIDHALEPGTCINIAWYLIATRQWHVDMINTLLDLARPLIIEEVQLNSTATGERQAA